MSHHATPVILIIEDNEHDVELIKWAFKQSSSPSELIWCRNKAMTLDYLYRRGAYSSLQNSPLPMFIFLDLKLESEYGLDILADIRADERFQEIPVYIWASSIEREDIHKSVKHEVSGYILKPSNVNQLAFDVTSLLQSHAQSSS